MLLTSNLPPIYSSFEIIYCTARVCVFFTSSTPLKTVADKQLRTGQSLPNYPWTITEFSHECVPVEAEHAQRAQIRLHPSHGIFVVAYLNAVGASGADQTDCYAVYEGSGASEGGLPICDRSVSRVKAISRLVQAKTRRFTARYGL